MRQSISALLLVLGVVVLVVGIAGGHWFGDVTGVVAILLALLRLRAARATGADSLRG